MAVCFTEKGVFIPVGTDILVSDQSQNFYLMIQDILLCKVTSLLYIHKDSNFDFFHWLPFGNSLIGQKHTIEGVTMKNKNKIRRSWMHNLDSFMDKKDMISLGTYKDLWRVC